MIKLILKEYFQYIVNDPSLFKKIPLRLWEEFSLHFRFTLSKILRTKKNASIIKKLHILRDDMEKAEPVYKPSLLWKDLYDQFERVLHVEDIRAFKTQRYNRRFSAFAPTDPVIYKMFLWLYRNEIKKRDTLKLLEKLEEPSLGKADIYEIQGKNISHDLLQSLDEFYNIYPYIQNKNKHIFFAELGGGYGRLGYIFLKAIPKCTYIMIDLPGSLVIAEYYLTHLFPKEKILTYEKSRLLKKFDLKILSKYKVVILAPWQLPFIEYKSLDIVANIYSFQEMTFGQIDNYFELINNKSNGLFYSKQYFISENPKDEIKITLKDYPVKKSWKKIFEKPSTMHQYTFETLYKIPAK